MTPNLSEMNCATCEHFDDGFCTLPESPVPGFIKDPKIVVCVKWADIEDIDAPATEADA
jgi:hypothetical protein